MSLILDALKKSDMERSRHRAPDIAANGSAATPAATPRWFWPVVGLLLLNGAALLYLVLKPAPDTALRVSEQISAPQQVNAVPAIAMPGSATAQPAQKAAVRSLLDETIRNTAARRANTGPAETTKPQSGAQATSTPPATDARNSLPTFSELRASGRLNLEPLNLELHVYNDDPASRFAFINGQKAREGESLRTGERVTEITRFGVILEYNGQQFQLPRD